MSGASTIEAGPSSASAGAGDGDPGLQSVVRTSRRRKWAWVAAALLAVVAVVAGIAIVWVPHYQPLRGDLFGEGPVGAPSQSEHNATVYSYRDDALLDLEFTFRNPGRFAATIEGFDDGPEFGVLKVKDIRVFDRWPKGCCLPSDARATHFPLTIPPRSTRAVVLELRMTNCEYYDRGTSVNWRSLWFPMTILGVHHKLTVSLENSSQAIFIDMPGPRTRACPQSRPPGL